MHRYLNQPHLDQGQQKQAEVREQPASVTLCHCQLQLTTLCQTYHHPFCNISTAQGDRLCSPSSHSPFIPCDPEVTSAVEQGPSCIIEN